MKKIVKLKMSDIKKLIKESIEMDELDFQSFHNDVNLQILRDAIDKNRTVSVAFVKKDGTVRHMAVRKNLSSYVASDREKSDAQLNVEQNHDLKKVVDINAYIKELKQLKLSNQTADMPVGEDELKQMAAKKAWRSINLKNVLGFLVGGVFKDLRDENQILERFGEEVNSQLTKSMVRAMDQEQNENNEGEIEEMSNDYLNEGKSDYDVYHKTYTSAINAALDYAEKKGYTYDKEETYREIGMGPRKPVEGKTNRFTISLKKNDKEQKKALHIQVYGMKEKYELNCYIN